MKFAVRFRRKLSAIRKDILLCLSSAALLVLSFPNFNLWITAWFGFVPLFFALKKKSNKEAFFLFFITGILFWSGIIYWLVHVTLTGTIVLVLYLALYFAVFGLLIRPCTRHSTPYALIFIPSVWVLLEYARSHLMTGFPWALLGYSQSFNLPVIQIAGITGVWGVSFLVMMVNVAIVEIIWSRSKGLRSRLKTTLILIIPFLILTLCYGYYRLSRSRPGDMENLIRVSVIQGNIPQELKWDTRYKNLIIDKYFTLTARAVLSKPDLIVWPEAAIPTVVEEDPELFNEVRDFIKEIKIPVVLGALTSDKDSYYNSAILLSGQGAVAGKYNKLHLVPFGEFIPFRKTFPFMETIAPIGDIERGHEFTIFKAARLNQPGVSFAVLVCFEDLFPELSREFVKKGASFLINITNDAWYKRTSAPFQHLQASVLRAVENRRCLVRATNTGVSAFISPAGEIKSTVKDESGNTIFVSGFDTQEIGKIFHEEHTFYNRFGDVFIGACFLFALYGIMRFRKIRNQQDSV